MKYWAIFLSPSIAVKLYALYELSQLVYGSTTYIHIYCLLLTSSYWVHVSDQNKNIK